MKKVNKKTEEEMVFSGFPLYPISQDIVSKFHKEIAINPDDISKKDFDKP